MKLIAQKINKKSAYYVYESETGQTVAVRTGRDPLTWNPVISAIDFANFNRIPLIAANKPVIGDYVEAGARVIEILGDNYLTAYDDPEEEDANVARGAKRFY